MYRMVQVGSFAWEGAAMAEYDGKVRIHVGAETNDLRKLQKEFDSVNAKLAKCYEKGDKLEALGVDKQSRQWKSLVYDTAQYEMRLEDLRERIQQVNSLNADKPVDGFEKIEKSSKKCFRTIQSGTKKSNGLFSNMASRLKSIALSLLVFNGITKGFNAMVSAMKEGFKNLAQYSSEYNGQMSALKSSMAETKNALAAAFEPVVNTVIPYLTQMIQWLNIAIDTVGQFFAALKGNSTYTKAGKQAIDYGKSLDAASKSAKRALAAFDELNVISESGGGGGSAGGEKTGADAFETGEVDSKIIDATDRIKAIMRPFIDSISEWWNELNFEPLLTSLDNLWVALEPFIGYAYDGLMFLLTDILEPLGTWTIEEALPAFFDLVATALSALGDVIETVKPGLQYIWDNVLVPIGEWAADAFVDALDMISGALEELANVFSSKEEEITTILTALGEAASWLWEKYLKPQFDFLMGAMGELFTYIDNVVGDIIDILAGIIGFITGVFIGDWETAMNGLVDVFEGIMNGLADIFEGIVNAIISGLNSLSFEVPDWVPEPWGGSTFGFNLEKLKLPRLANGAVIQGGQPFAAILGDQRFGQTNIETPIKTMVDAFKQALSEMGGNAGGQYTFVAQLDGEVLFRETVRQNEIFKKSTGSSAYE